MSAFGIREMVNATIQPPPDTFYEVILYDRVTGEEWGSAPFLTLQAAMVYARFRLTEGTDIHCSMVNLGEVEGVYLWTEFDSLGARVYLAVRKARS